MKLNLLLILRWKVKIIFISDINKKIIYITLKIKITFILRLK